MRCCGIVLNRKRRCYQRRLVHLRVEPAHFDWRWRERPALASAGVGSLARDPLATLRRVQAESIGTTINFRPAAITNRGLRRIGALMVIANSAAPNQSHCVDLADSNSFISPCRRGLREIPPGPQSQCSADRLVLLQYRPFARLISALRTSSRSLCNLR
jgi:hypothetical protein